MKPRFLSLFSGCGALDLGFLRAGCVSVGGFDIDRGAVALRNTNIARDSFVHDLKSGLPDPLAFMNLDLVIAGPPCQGFSTIGRRKTDDERNGLLVTAAELCAHLGPKCAVIENVPGVRSEPMSKYWRTCLGTLRARGYRVEEVALESADFGIPQIRKRIFAIAHRATVSRITPPVKEHRRVLREALTKIEDLPDHEPELLVHNSQHEIIARFIREGQKLSDVRLSMSCVPSWTIPSVFGRITRSEREVLEAVRLLRRRNRKRLYGDGDPVSMRLLDAHLGWTCAGQIQSLVEKQFLRVSDCGVDLRRTFNGKYRRLSMDGLSPTVDSFFLSAHHFLHPLESRGMTLREAARIQGFPDSYSFSGCGVRGIRYIANGVPPPLAEAVAKSVLPLLRK